MRLGVANKNRSSDENAFLELLDKHECETVDPLAFAVFGDLRDDHGEQGNGFRRIAECKTTKALVTAYRVVANELAGISPLSLARSFAGQPGVAVAEGDGVAFVCGRGALAAIKKSDLVRNYDDFPALYSARLPVQYREPTVLETLRRSAFNVGKIAGKPIYVFSTVELMAATLEKLYLDVIVF